MLYITKEINMVFPGKDMNLTAHELELFGGFLDEWLDGSEREREGVKDKPYISLEKYIAWL